MMDKELEHQLVRLISAWEDHGDSTLEFAKFLAQLVDRPEVKSSFLQCEPSLFRKFVRNGLQHEFLGSLESR